MSVKKFLTLFADGTTRLVSAIASSAGATDKDKIVATGSDGKLALSLMPAGLDIAAEEMEAGESVSGGDFVNIFDYSGIRKIRLADASNNRPAHGFVLNNIALGASGQVYTSGSNGQLSSLTPGTKYFLHTTPGKVSATKALTDGEFVQALGTAISANSLRFEFDDPIYID